MVVVLLICCGGGFYFVGQITNSVDKSQEKVAEKGDTYVNQILSNWDSSTLIKLSTSDYASEYSEQEFTDLFSKYESTLGKFVSGSGKARLMEANMKNGETEVTYKYTNSATFEKGKASVVLEMTQEDELWKISQFRVEPD